MQVANGDWQVNFNAKLDFFGIAKIDASEEDLWLAVERAELKQLIQTLPEGLDTKIGEGGHTLSGGQRQRLSIARAFLKDAPVLLLDEATSHLDSISERAVHRSLKSLMEHRTTLVIAHRLSTVRDAHTILVMSDGEVVETGSHGELLAKNGLYAHLISQQLSAGSVAA